jgi:hypothetical protein
VKQKNERDAVLADASVHKMYEVVRAVQTARWMDDSTAVAFAEE